MQEVFKIYNTMKFCKTNIYGMFSKITLLKKEDTVCYSENDTTSCVN